MPIWLLFLGFWLAFQMILRSQPLTDPGRSGTSASATGFSSIATFPTPIRSPGAMPASTGFRSSGAAECLMSLVHGIGGIRCPVMLMNALLAGLAAWIGKRFIDGGLHAVPGGGDRRPRHGDRRVPFLSAAAPRHASC